MEQPSKLLQRFARGDLDAFESLFRQFQGEVYRWIVRIVREHGAAEDLTIETFWRIHRAHARFDPERNFAAWARRIATNTALDYLKVARREVELPEDLPDLRSSALGDPGVRQDVRERVGKAFGELPAKLRVAATLALIEEEPYKEIADALGISVGTVKLRVFRAVRLLRKQLAGVS
ncbi:MAG TPA: RNA polymerase sigma factor [Terriglobales bacterium]|jgi:RNA polymerase sigma-70 factor (ECF subfamily)|nr:RNA polymerase sigma factor [Terriglobales bacterium]